MEEGKTRKNKPKVEEQRLKRSAEEESRSNDCHVPNEAEPEDQNEVL